MALTVKSQALALGADEVKADRVAEAAVRRGNAQRQGQAFIYIDVVHELEDLYRDNGAAEEMIENAKRGVWSAAREISAELGFPLEECLFFCFHEAADLYRESLAAKAG